MKCPECQHSQRAREGLTCKGCGYRFLFNPREFGQYQLTDGKFLAAVKKASRAGKVYFTENQLYAAYLAGAPGARAGYVVAVVLMVMMGVLLASGVFLALWILVPVAWLLYVAYQNAPQAMTQEKFSNCLRNWQDDGRTIDQLIQEPALHDPPPDWEESDIYDYGVERILIVQRDILVDLLVRNNLHAEQRMAVVSRSGYPQYIASRVWKMLESSPEIPVFLLHDADPIGVQMKRDLENEPSWSARGRRIIDLGFFPEDFTKLKRTRNVRVKTGTDALPADMILLGSLATGLGACFVSQATFADELLREHRNALDSSSSFG